MNGTVVGMSMAMAELNNVGPTVCRTHFSPIDRTYSMFLLVK